MTQKIIFQIVVDYDLKDIRDLIGDYTVEDGKLLVVSEEQLAILILAYQGAQYWFKNGKLHRDNDLPAVIYADGTQYWYQNGKFHRDNDLPLLSLERMESNVGGKTVNDIATMTYLPSLTQMVLKNGGKTEKCMIYLFPPRDDCLTVAYTRNQWKRPLEKLDIPKF